MSATSAEPPASSIQPRRRSASSWTLRGEVTIAELCRREGIAESLYDSWSKEFLEAGKRRLAGDTARSATTSEVKDLKRQALEFDFAVTPPTSDIAHLEGIWKSGK